jgi:hypothetical protein
MPRSVRPLFVNHYGSSEIYTFTTEPRAAAKPGSAGKAGLNQRIRVVKFCADSPDARAAIGEEGQIIADMASDEAFEGYWRRPDADAHALRGAWYLTGDTGYFDAEGDLFVTGRVARRRCAGPRHCIAGGGRAFFERRQDQRLSRQLVLPVRRDGVDMPDSIKQPNALYVDLRDDPDADQWQRLLGACGASLGATAPDWLMVRDQVLRLLQRDQSLNLVVAG